MLYQGFKSPYPRFNHSVCSIVGNAAVRFPPVYGVQLTLTLPKVNKDSKIQVTSHTDRKGIETLRCKRTETMDGKPYDKPISKLPVYVLHVLTGRCENFTSTTVNEIWTWFQSLVDSTVKVKG